MWYHPSKLKKLSSPLVDMWTNRENIGVNIYPYNGYNALGSCLLDRFPECIIKDVVLIQGKNAKERAEARKSRLISLNRDYDRSLGHSRHAVIVTDAAVPLLSTRHQAVAAWNVWHKGSCISEDWQAGGLAISDDTETFAIAGAFSALASEMDINNVDEIHVFTDSTTAIRQSLDPSIHSAQECALEILFLITPWVEQGNKRIHFHHVPDSEDYMFMPHRLVHNLASSTKIEAGFSAPHSLAFDKKQITDDVLREWGNLL